jgi:two-component system response regulator HydG
MGGMGGVEFEIHQASPADDSATVIEAVRPVAVVLVDGRSPTDRVSEGAGIRPITDVVARIRRQLPTSQILVVLDQSLSRQQGSTLIQAGASSFVQQTASGIHPELLRGQLATALERFDRQRGLCRSSAVDTIFETTGVVGCSRAMGDVLRRAARASRISDVPVLITGESGTGKQLLAETIHRLDTKRARRRLTSVNCAAITGSLADSALFGHVRGAYTGATDHRMGHFRSADGGTVLLDEVGDLDPRLQPKLLRVLQEGLVLPVGADEEQPVDVRVIAATNRPLETLVERGTFRLDLFQRLNVIRIDIPPLCERREDIPLLVAFFLKRYADYCPTPITGLDDEAHDFILHQRFEGNVRELENLIRRVLAFKTEGDRITLDDLHAVGAGEANEPSRSDDGVFVSQVVDSACTMMESGRSTFTELVDECERRLLARAIERSRQSHTDLARELGLSRRTLYNKRKKHHL